MEDWKKSEGTFNLACDLERASGMMQNTCVKIEHVTKRFGEDIVLQEVNLSLKTGNMMWIFLKVLELLSRLPVFLHNIRALKIWRSWQT